MRQTTNRFGAGTFWLALAFALGACDSREFDEPMDLGGETVSAETLNLGHQVYRKNCIACHGEDGDGDGASARALDPKPRDFTAGLFKYKSTPGDALPMHTDLTRTVRQGLAGTDMNAFALDADELDAVVYYLKTFSSRWRSEHPGTPIRIPLDPWGGERESAVNRGEIVYHAVAQCWSCHPSYLSRPEIESMLVLSDQEKGALSGSWRSSLGQSRAVDTAFGKLLPPDFYGGTLRAARTGPDLYRTIAAGVGGTEMPAWSQELTSKDVWALVHYVRELRRLGDLRGRKKR